jgi:hypothetical protein
MFKTKISRYALYAVLFVALNACLTFYIYERGLEWSFNSNQVCDANRITVVQDWQNSSLWNWLFNTTTFHFREKK